jgi:two-component system, chemotaxis family, protein-glutamate methylesterase/glutaminase
MKPEPLRILIADDSPFICRLLRGYFHSEPGFEVVGVVHDGQGAIEQAKLLRPDAITLDLGMPKMDGLEALASIMRDTPTPVVVISGVSGRAATRTLQALDLGAVDFVLKFTPGQDIDPEALRREIRAKVRTAANIQVVRLLGGALEPVPKQRPARSAPAPQSGSLGLVVIGASTGGPGALRELLAELHGDFDQAIIVVQHIPGSFTGVLAAQLNRSCALEVREADDGEVLVPGVVFVAPGGYHLLVRSGARLAVVAGTPKDGHCPSIDITMESAAQILGSRVTGVVLTGMGDDGTKGLRAIHRRAGETFAQEAESCVVNGMPQRAIEAQVVDQIATPARIGQLLQQKTKRKEPNHATADFATAGSLSLVR